MTMTNEEILSKYNEASVKQEAIETLAKINECDVGTIRRILVNCGIKYQCLPRPKKHDKAENAKSNDTDAEYETSDGKIVRKNAPKQRNTDRQNQIIHDALCCYRERMEAEIEAIRQKYEEAKAVRVGVISEIDDMLTTKYAVSPTE